MVFGSACASAYVPFVQDNAPLSRLRKSPKLKNMGFDRTEDLTEDRAEDRAKDRAKDPAKSRGGDRVEPRSGVRSEVRSEVRVAAGAPASARVWLESVSAGMRTVEAVIRELSQNDVPMLVVAEHGSGKAAAAARIHALSARTAEPFEIHQGREVSEEILAGRDRQGGTIYLQEVGDLSAAAQKELVRQIGLSGQGNAGAQRRVPRFVCGTSRELEPEVKAGKFREDLYYGISGVCLRLPPLRQRKEDIPVLRDWFLSAAARDFTRAVPVLSAETQNFFLEYNWPGNIRELKDAARAIVALGDEALAMGGLRSLLRRADRAGNGEKISLKDAARAASRDAEREIILQVLTRTRWNRRRAAQELQISYKALLYKLKQIGYEEYGA
jgi:two-component system, NtrC family, response regulator AtoC